MYIFNLEFISIKQYYEVLRYIFRKCLASDFFKLFINTYLKFNEMRKYRNSSTIPGRNIQGIQNIAVNN